MSTLRVNNMTNVGGSGPTYASGMIIQTVQGVLTTQYSTTSSSASSTGLTATITPKSTASKILVIANIAGVYKQGDVAIHLGLRRDGSRIIKFGGYLGYTGTTGRDDNSAGVSYLDSPATTAAVVYSIEIAVQNSSGTVGMNNDNAVSTIVLLEVAA